MNALILSSSVKNYKKRLKKLIRLFKPNCENYELSLDKKDNYVKEEKNHHVYLSLIKNVARGQTGYLINHHVEIKKDRFETMDREKIINDAIRYENNDLGKRLEQLIGMFGKTRDGHELIMNTREEYIKKRKNLYVYWAFIGNTVITSYSNKLVVKEKDWQKIDKEKIIKSALEYL